MADELSTKRIINLPAESGPAEGDVFVVDNESTGTKKLPILSMIDETLSKSHQAADAKVTGIRIADVYGDYVPEINGWIDGEYIKREDGTVGYNATYHRTDYIEIIPNTMLSFENEGGNYANNYNAWYDENKNFISSFATKQNGIAIIGTPVNAKYMRLSFNKTTTNIIRIPYTGSVAGRLYELSTINGIYSLQFSNWIYYYGQGIYGLAPTRIGSMQCATAKTKIKISINDGFKYAVFRFSSVKPSTDTEISNTGWLTSEHTINEGEIFLVNMAKTDDSAISSDDVNALTIRPVCLTENDLVINDVNVSYTKGTVSGNGTVNRGANGATTDILYNIWNFTIKENARAVVILYGGGSYIGKINSNGDIDKIAGNWMFFAAGTHDLSNYLAENNADSIRISVLPTDGTTVTDETAQTWGEEHCTVLRTKYVPLNVADALYEKRRSESINYVVGADMLKKPIDVDYIGQLQYFGAFCRYNDKYYSINGSSIAEQDSDFAVLRDVSLNTGHGNSLQLGGSGFAYASGWNDNKIYKVDLENLTVTDVITLPTTGYTTGVVDEVNNVAYIFQRDSYPDTEANYNFITYDITNQQILKTSKILAFGAIQSADFFDDKIFAINGLGTSTVPNGYRVYDTNGKILAEYFIGDFTTEPEGVCIDRNSHELYMGLVNKNIYRITS